MPITFNGVTTYIPQVLSQTIDATATSATGTGSGVVALVGQSAGGQPKTPLYFSNPTDAAAVLVSGDLVDAIKLAFNAAVGAVVGPTRICCVRVNPATQGTLTLSNSATGVITLTTAQYGAIANQTAVTVAAATTAGKKITVTGASGLNMIGDNLQDLGFSIQYTGTGSASTMTIGATTVTSTCTGATGDNLNVDLTIYNTVTLLVNYINGTGKYVATVKSLNPNRLVTDLDQVTAVDIKTGVYAAIGNMIAVIEWVNANVGTTLTATRASTTVALSPDNVGPVYVTGGSNGSAPSNTDWQNSFDALKTEDTDIVCPLTGSSTLHAMADAHAVYMSGPLGKRERIAVVGGVAGLSTTAAASAAQALNSSRTTYCYPGIKTNDGVTGVVSRPPYMAAAMIAGYIAGLGLTDSITAKLIKVTGLETNLIPSDIEFLARAGVNVLQYAPGAGYKIVHGLLSYTGDQIYTRTEITTRRAIDFVVRSTRQLLENTLIGKSSAPAALNTATGLVSAQLLQLATQGLLVGDATNPPFRNITASANGDTINVSFEAQVIVPVNYVALTAYARTFTSGAATA